MQINLPLISLLSGLDGRQEHFLIAAMQNRPVKNDHKRVRLGFPILVSLDLLVLGYSTLTSGAGLSHFYCYRVRPSPQDSTSISQQ